MLELVLLVALIILAVLVWKPFKNNVIGALDQRAVRIREQLDEAERLQEEAKDLLAKHQRQLAEGEKLAGEIRERAEAETKRLQDKLKADFEASVERRTRQAEERIEQEEARATAEVRQRAIDLAVRATRKVLEGNLGEQRAQQIMQSSIQEVDRKLA